MRKHLLSIAIAGSLLTSAIGFSTLYAADDAVVAAKFAADGQVQIPKNWRQWIYVGTPLTPNALNNGKAAFPEFHNVYIEPSAYAYWQKTGKFANGTQIAKELVLVRQKDKDEMNDNGSTGEVSGVGYFQGEFQGLELTIKDLQTVIQKNLVDGRILALDINPNPTIKPLKYFQPKVAIAVIKEMRQTILSSPSFIRF